MRARVLRIHGREGTTSRGRADSTRASLLCSAQWLAVCLCPFKYYKGIPSSTSNITRNPLIPFKYYKGIPTSLKQTRVRRAARLLRDPHYGEYHINFSNVLPLSYSPKQYAGDKERTPVGDLAEADEFEAVRSLKDCFGDYVAVNPDLFTLNVLPHWHSFPMCDIMDTTAARSAGYKPELFDEVARRERVTDGLVSLMLSLRKRPHIRCTASSRPTQLLALALKRRMAEAGTKRMFDTWRPPDTPPVLLVLDRRDDPVTPLLQPWRYQGMLHELLGIKNNAVEADGVEDAAEPEPQGKHTLHIDTDEFYRNHLYADWGELREAVGRLGENYRQHKRKNEEVTKNDGKTSEMTVEAARRIREFLKEFPTFNELEKSVERHTALSVALSRRVAEQTGSEEETLRRSKLEQEISTCHDYAEHFGRLCERLEAPHDALGTFRVRQLLIFYLRYEEELMSRREDQTTLSSLMRARLRPPPRQPVVFRSARGTRGANHATHGSVAPWVASVECLGLLVPRALETTRRGFVGGRAAPHLPALHACQCARAVPRRRAVCAPSRSSCPTRRRGGRAGGGGGHGAQGDGVPRRADAHGGLEERDARHGAGAGGARARGQARERAPGSCHAAQPRQEQHPPHSDPSSHTVRHTASVPDRCGGFLRL